METDRNKLILNDLIMAVLERQRLWLGDSLDPTRALTAASLRKVS